IHPGTTAELVEVEMVLVAREPDRATRPSRLGPGRGELLLDHAEGQELVALKAQDGLQAFHVLIVEEPVAARSPAGGQQPLVLQVPDLGDGDVRKLPFQTRAHSTDRLGRFTARGRLDSSLGGGAHLERKISRYLPI